MVRLKRAYEPPEARDGYRVLVERLWPRGVRKEALRLDAWLKDVSPSPELRKWYGHDVARWHDFVTRYRAELRKEPAAAAFAELLQHASGGPVTLVYAARDPEHNSARVLRDELEAALATKRR